MKPQKRTFKHPVHAFQIFRHIHVYDKSSRSLDDRKEHLVWHKADSASGFIRDEELYLPEEAVDDRMLKHGGMVTIEDDRHPLPDPSYAHAAEQVKNRYFAPGSAATFDIFRMLWSNEPIELFLEYGYFEVGIPERQNFLLSILRQNCPVEVLINGKLDYTHSSRKERLFKEQRFIIEYLGSFGHCFAMRPPFDPVVKTIPQAGKTINLLKPLW